MVTKAEFDKLQSRVDNLELKIKLYNKYFQGIGAILAQASETTKVVDVTIPDRIEEDISKAGGFKEESVGLASDVEKPAGKYDDPVVVRDPPNWKKGSFVGKKYSECSIEFLKDLAGFLDWAADDDEKNGITVTSGKPRCEYRRRDADRARRWAAWKKANPDSKSKPAAAKDDYTFNEIST